jgi:DNA-binding IclR family transcriptional regulator
VSAIGSPLFTDDSNEAVGSLAVIVPTQRLEFANLDRLVESVKEAAARISQRTRSVIESRQTDAVAAPHSPPRPGKSA